MSLGNGTTNGLSGDSPEFAYYADTATANAAAAALIASGQSPDPVVMVGPAPATAVAMWWQGATIGYAVGGGSVTPYADFAALVAAVPSPSVGDTAQIAGGGIVKYTATGWLGDIGVLSGLSAAPRLQIANGATATILGVPFTRTSGVWIKRRMPTILKRPARYIPFGDSTAQSYTASQTIIEGAEIPIPGSGQTLVAYNSSPGAHGILLSKGVLLIGSAGISGESLAQLIARSGSAAGVNRKAFSDIIASKADIVYLAICANDVKLWGVTTTQGDRDALIASRIEAVKTLTSVGIHVIDHGIYGWDSTTGLIPSNLPYVRAGILEFNSRLADASVTDPYWHFADPAYITHDGTGAFIPENTSDGIHLNGIGALAISTLTAPLIASIYEFGARGQIVYDPQKDFAEANAVGGVPAGHTLTGAATFSNKVSAYNKFTFRQALSSQGSWTFTLPALTTVLSGLTRGTRLYVQMRMTAINVATGLPYTGGKIYARANIWDTANAAGISVFNDYTSSLIPNDCYITIPLTLPINAADMGASSKIFISSVNWPTGTYDVTIYPYIIGIVED